MPGPLYIVRLPASGLMPNYYFVNAYHWVSHCWEATVFDSEADAYTAIASMEKKTPRFRGLAVVETL